LRIVLHATAAFAALSLLFFCLAILLCLYSSAFAKSYNRVVRMIACAAVRTVPCHAFGSLFDGAIKAPHDSGFSHLTSCAVARILAEAILANLTAEEDSFIPVAVANFVLITGLR
jgi:hypothetical protein